MDEKLSANSPTRLPLSWANWVAFDGGGFKLLPTTSGISPIRISDQNRLACTGDTGLKLRERLSDLRRHTLARGDAVERLSHSDTVTLGLTRRAVTALELPLNYIDPRGKTGARNLYGN